MKKDILERLELFLIDEEGEVTGTPGTTTSDVEKFVKPSNVIGMAKRKKKRKVISGTNALLIGGAL